MKSRMTNWNQKLIALCLTFCMVSGMVPTLPLSTSMARAAGPTDNTLLYDFKQNNGDYKDDIKQMKYTDTADTWEFDTCCDELKRDGYASHKGYGIGFEATGLNQYASFRIKVNQPGLYDATQAFIVASSGGKYNVYLAPAGTPEAKRRSAQFLLGTVDCFGESEAWGKIQELKNTAIETAGEYYLSYEVVGKTNGHCIYLTNFKLNQTGNIGDIVKKNIELSFPSYAGKSPIKDLNIDEYGFEINKKKTSQQAIGYGEDGFRIQGYGLQSQVNAINNPPESDTAVDFNVPVDGAYQFTFSGGKFGGGGFANIFVDDSYVGTYDFYDKNGISKGNIIETRALNLTKGIHTITCRSMGHSLGSWGYNQYIGNITFKILEKMPEIKLFDVNIPKTSLAVGETMSVTAKTVMDTGYECEFKNKINGSADDNYKIMFASSDSNVLTVDAGGKITAKAAGKADVSVTAVVDGATKTSVTSITVSNSQLSTVEVKLPTDKIYTQTNTPIVLVAKADDGTIIDNGDIKYEISSDNDKVFIIDKTNIVAVNEGTANLVVKATFNGVTVTQTVPVTIYNAFINEITLTGDRMILATTDLDGMQLRLMAKFNTGVEEELSGTDITYESSNPEVAYVSEKGLVLPVAQGHTKIIATIKIGGIVKTATYEITVGSGKTKSMLYTDDKRAAAQENTKKYEWAREMSNTAADKADEILPYIDKIYDTIPYEGIPRSFQIGLKGDPLAFTCPSCEKELRAEYGYYPWLIHPLTEPWKIQCPNCRRKFPSNDFESYYKSGLDEKGVFDPEKAKANGQAYLKNVLYPEKDKDGVTGWCVDDGFGYVTGNTAAGGVKEVKTFIAYYMHWGLFYSAGGSVTRYGTEFIPGTLRKLRDAYLYTGDIRYGRAGAILIDRMADVYPSYNLDQWAGQYQNSDGGFNMGKILGNIWETEIASDFITAYDAFYPAMEDPRVIDYLQKKSKEHGLANPKSSAQLIRENCENGILREIYKECNNARIYGNFGMQQRVVAQAAVALNTMPESKDMIDWIFRKESSVQSILSTHHNDGGNVMPQLMDVVDRDGTGNEVAAGYNSIWLYNMVKIAEILAGYEGYPTADLYKNPKFIKMFSAIVPLTLVSKFTAQIGDEGQTADQHIAKNLAEICIGYQRIRDPRLAQMVYFLNDNSVEGLHSDIFTKDPESIGPDIKEEIKKYGMLKFESENRTGYGFAVLRDGEYFKGSGVTKTLDTQHDFWMFYGKTNGVHPHMDKLNLGIEAYGFNMAPDLGYPHMTGPDPERMQWTRSTISHNTVIVNEVEQTPTSDGNPMHFDAAEKVQLMDVDAPEVYDAADIYRRTVVMVKVDDEVSYGVDFFRVKGGRDHLYSFHSQSDEVLETDGLNLVKQVNEKGEYVGSYAGPDVAWGPDPKSDPKEWFPPLKYPKGYTWLHDIRKDAAPKSGKFSITFKQKDFRNVLPNPIDINLRMTMLSDTPMDEVTIAAGKPPQIGKNIKSLDYVIVRHKGQKDIDTFFTTIFEPYKDNRYLSDIDTVSVSVVEGKQGDLDTVRAVKVTHKNGKIDYVVYATNNNVLYRIDNKFNFRGFVGVCSYINDSVVYSYINDGDTIGDRISTTAYTGEVVDFTKEHQYENTITIKCDADFDPALLKNRYVYVANDKMENGAYRIQSATKDANGNLVLNLGNTTLIRKYKDATKLDQGFVYNIVEGQKVRIPLSDEMYDAPFFKPIMKQVTEVGAKIEFSFSATSPANRKLTYSAKYLPYGAQFDPEKKLFSWIPARGQIGNQYATIQVTDGINTVAQSVEIQVYSSTSSGGGGGSSGSVTQKPTITQPDNTKESAKTEKDSAEFEVLSDKSITAANKLGSIEFPQGSFDKKSKGKLEIEKDGKKIAVKVTVNGKSVKPESAVKVSLNYNPNEEMKDVNCIIVRDASGNIIPNGKYQDEKLLMFTETLGKFTVEYNPIIFNDLNNHEWANDAVMRLAAREIIKGVSATAYNPAANITRADFTTLIVRTFGFSEQSSEMFKDIDANAYYASAVSTAQALGIVVGSNGKFNPTANITREDMMVILLRATEKAKCKLEGSAQAEFADANLVSDYAKNAVEKLIASKIVTGSNGKINPKGSATRAEVAVILDRLIFNGN